MSFWSTQVKHWWSGYARTDPSRRDANGTSRRWSPTSPRRRWATVDDGPWGSPTVWSVTPATTVDVVPCRATPGTISSATTLAPTTEPGSVWTAGLAVSAMSVCICTVSYRHHILFANVQMINTTNIENKKYIIARWWGARKAKKNSHQSWLPIINLDVLMHTHSNKTWPTLM